MEIIMATQFKDIAFPAAQTSSRAPTAALTAVNRAFGGTSTGAGEQTLDELAGQAQSLDLAAWDAALAKAEAAIAARDAHWDEHIEPLFADAGAELRKEPNWQAYLPLTKAAARAAVELARLTPPDQNGFILAVHMLCSTAMLGVEDIVPHGGEALVDEIKRHAGDLLDGAVVRERFMGGALAHWQRLWAGVEEARAEYRRYEAEVYTPVVKRYEQAIALLDAGTPTDAVQNDIDALGQVEAHDSYLAWGYCDARDQLYRAPAPGPAELAVKLQLMAEEQDWARCGERTAEVLASDARRFGRLGAFLQRDADLLSAFAEFRRGTELWLASGPGHDLPEDDAAADARTAALEDLVIATQATTVEGVLAKLRRAFQGIVGEAWSDRAMTDPKHPDFVEGLQSADWYPRLMWHAIDDLAKLGGVDLASHGTDGQPAPTPRMRPAAADTPDLVKLPRPEAKAAGLRSILDERNTVLKGLNEPSLTDEEGALIGQQLMEVECRLIDTPAVTADDMMAKLLLIAQIAEEGHEAEEDLAAKVLAEARALGFAQGPARSEAA
ncbi:hypothetical protein [Sphingomonas sp. 3-13AW]|uniref:hypothetical protein n=1 Tax=Sphingomonas sp. 3-13AW TaxID=3050450 RepID=UPI003BB5E843